MLALKISVEAEQEDQNCWKTKLACVSSTRVVMRLTYSKECRSQRFTDMPQFMARLSIRSQQFKHRQLGGVDVLSVL
jgi:hypothetical protein